MTDQLRATQIRDMFDAIAPRYDRLNTIFSLRRDRAWRRRAARLAGLKAGDTALDLCTGTGALAYELLPYVRPGGRVIGVDSSPGMLRRATAEPGLEFELGDVISLPYPAQSFEAVTMGFGLRNVVDRQAALREMRRVLRGRGRVVILEFSPLRRSLRAAGYGFYLGRLLPAMAGLVNRQDGAAYRYLAESVPGLPSPTALAGEMKAAGIRQVRIESMTFGIVSIHTGRRD